MVMQSGAQPDQIDSNSPFFDVLIIGAGLSGIGSAVHLRKMCPELSFALIERRAAIGGTWDLFRYPGIRSDSDMHTLGYRFKPWEAKEAIANGPAILNYVNETADEYSIRENIHFGEKLEAAHWRSESSDWLIRVSSDSGDRYYRCNFLMMCAGYYSYDRGHQPEFAGRDSFSGDWIHPQFWPQDLDYTDKKVVVIGSGATAMTVVPNMARKARHVTMLQRSPTYVIGRPSVDPWANRFRRWLPKRWAYSLTRFKNTVWQQAAYNMTRIAPDFMRRTLMKPVHDEIGHLVDVDKHFSPRYNPWDQRLCLIPDNDLFEVIKSNQVDVVTDQIERVTPTGVQLVSGEHLDADIIVSATGIELVILGGAEFLVDGEALDMANEWTYKGMMCTNLPNMVHTFGYINASWTLRADLIAQWTCRLLNHMRRKGYRKVTPRCPDALAQHMPRRLWIDDFSAGYMQRALPLFPKQGDQAPWINPQNYRKDRKLFRNAPIEDGALIFETAADDSPLRKAS